MLLKKCFFYPHRGYFSSIYFQRKWKGSGGRGRKRNIDIERATLIGCLTHVPLLGLGNLQPGPLTWPGIQPATHQSIGQHSNHWSNWPGPFLKIWFLYFSFFISLHFSFLYLYTTRKPLFPLNKIMHLKLSEYCTE